MNDFFSCFNSQRLTLLCAPDGGGGGTPPAQPPATPPPATPPPENTPPADEAGEEWKGWWAGQLSKETRDKHKDRLLGLKGKQLGEVFDEYFSNSDKLKEAVVFPGKDAKPEEVAAFLKRMDIPASAEGYELDAKLVPEGTDEQRGQAAAEIAAVIHRNGLTKKQGQAIFAEYAKMLGDIGRNIEAQRKEQANTFEARLLRETGGEKAAAETREYFKRALVALGDKALVEKLEKTGMLYDTSLVRAFADIWKAGNQEPPLPGGTGGSEEKKAGALPMGEEFNKRYGERRK
ncbi:MAG: hypothetical protein LBG27_00420 [Spirochaetaceae bacterium]|jgi:hypothetical protein|nr:hypothetical protein [Spirochaetaceae bacterium]